MEYIQTVVPKFFHSINNESLSSSTVANVSLFDCITILCSAQIPFYIICLLRGAPWFSSVYFCDRNSLISSFLILNQFLQRRTQARMLFNHIFHLFHAYLMSISFWLPSLGNQISLHVPGASHFIFHFQFENGYHPKTRSKPKSLAKLNCFCFLPSPDFPFH